MMQWSRLLTDQRFGQTADRKRSRDHSPFLIDLDRITFSGFVRRLQDKTQVHPLSEGGRVRSRLTHSIEVASVGRSLGFRAGQKICEGLEDLSPHDVGCIVQTACLAHDIGNPPFGHAGESAIASWFDENVDFAFSDGMSESQRLDLTRFEGNAQGFRILNRLDMYGYEAGGFRLTYAALGAFTKYPRGASLPGYQTRTHAGDKKAGFCASEKDIFTDVAEALGLIRRAEGLHLWCRHPLAFLMEAADDICYSIADLEDGVIMGLVRFEDVEPRLIPIARPENSPVGQSWYDGFNNSQKLGYLRGAAIGNLVDAVTDAFLTEETALLDGTFNGDLLDNTRFGPAVKECKQFADKAIFESDRKIRLEAAGFEVLGGLLNLFVPALVDLQAAEGELMQTKPHSQRLLRQMDRLPMAGADRYEHLLAATDFVSGLSDRAAVSLFKELKGISL